MTGGRRQGRKRQKEKDKSILTVAFAGCGSPYLFVERSGTKI